ncbi:MAG TPA: hypothetical protein VL156_08315 [Terriglobales bacterium]|nr:hypothetical protein [Terriglobales bacterium]
MELLDRYIQAVRFWLPKPQRDDIAAELSEDIRSQIEERESALARPLNEAEVADILKQHGRPLLVANRFGPQQHLIGPMLFPIYWFVLRIVALFYLLPSVLVWTGVTVARAAHSGKGLLEGLASFWSAFWPMALFTLGAITLLFALLERLEAKSKFMDHWDPRKLPPIRDPNRIPISKSLIEVTFNLVFCIWLVAGMWYQTSLDFLGVSIALAPVWTYLFWGFFSLTAANMVISGANLFRPYWSKTRAWLRLVSDSIGSALFCWLLKSNIFLSISVRDIAAEKTARVAGAVNWWSEKMFPYAVGACLIILLVDVYRIIRVRRASRSAALLNAVHPATQCGWAGF